MASVFDGVSTTLASVFGAPVTITADGSGASSVVQGVFRRAPVEVVQDDGSMLLAHQPVLSVPANSAASIARNDQVEPGDGKTYRIVSRETKGSPADDGMQMFHLEEVQ